MSSSRLWRGATLALALLLAREASAACERTGSAAEVTSSANSGSTSVTVPADATLMVVGVGGFFGTANQFSGGSVTIAGASLTAISGADASTSFWQGVIFYRVNPTTGSQTFAWDWVGAGAPDAGVSLTYAFYKGIDTGSPLKDSFASQAAGSPTATDSMTATTGDCIVAWGSAFTGGAGAHAFTWTNTTELTDTFFGTGAHSLSEAFPSGDTTVTASEGEDQDIALVAAVFRVAGAAAPTNTLLLMGVGP